MPATGTVSSIALPSFFNNSPSARLRFYYYNGSGPNASLTGSRPKISIDNLTVTAIPSTPCVTPAAGPTSLTFNNITETSVQGNFLAASPSVNEYIVVMSTNSSLTSLPIDGQTYFVGDNIGDGTVIDKGSDLSFTASGLTGATTYYFFVFPVNSVCTGGPLYLTTNPLSDDVRSFMEPRFGADFSNVKVHTDGKAVQMARNVGAQAFAYGSDVYFGAGKSPGNNELTAHELTHVVQQTGGVQRKQVGQVQPLSL